MPNQTLAIPACDPCPPRAAWPTKNLIRGTCPKCGRWEGTDGKKSARMLAARRLLGRLADV